MTPGHRATGRALALAFYTLALVFANAATARAQQADPPRRPQGPAAGPIIKLPRGAGATDEQPQQTATAKGAGERAAAPQKWEYCAIDGFFSHQKGFNTYVPAVRISYYSGGAEEVEGSSEQGPLAVAFAKLGDDGWELAAVLPGGESGNAAYFFKRPK